MTLPASGVISLYDVNVEFGRASTTLIALNDADVRLLFGVPTGPISLANGYGKTYSQTLSINTSQQQLNLRTWALGNGWNGVAPVQITIANGVYIWSDNTSIPALVVDGSWPGGLTLVNNGFIMGKGGIGAGTVLPGGGGPAMSLGVSFSMVNNGSLGGGGGGGGSIATPGGGGAGGGAGGAMVSTVFPQSTPGGAIGQKGTDGQSADEFSPYYFAGGAGGRIMPGLATVDPYPPNGGLQLGGDAGGEGCWYQWSNGDPYPHTQYVYSPGGQGGGGGNPGSTPVMDPGLGSGGGGGGWGASGAQSGVGGGWPAGAGNPGLGGKAVNLNGFTLSKTGVGPVYGVIS